MVKLSIVVPVYNVEKYLARCIDSLLEQSFSDYEIIFVNDGSTDNSLKIIENYAQKDDRIIILSQQNQGPSVARNLGIKNAQGKFIGFIDPDDWIDKDFFKILVELAEKNNADFAMAGIRCFFPDENLITDNQTMNDITDELSKKVSYFPNGSTCDKVYKLSLFKDNDIYFPEGMYYEDNVVLLKLAYYSHCVVFTNQVSYFYFINPNGTCRNNSENFTQKRDDDKIQIAKMMIDFAKQVKMSKKEIFEVKKFIYRTIGHFFANTDSEYYVQIEEIMGHNFLNYMQNYLKWQGYTFFQRIFSIKNVYRNNKKKKVICICGLRITLRSN